MQLTSQLIPIYTNKSQDLHLYHLDRSHRVVNRVVCYILYQSKNSSNLSLFSSTLGVIILSLLSTVIPIVLAIDCIRWCAFSLALNAGLILVSPFIASTIIPSFLSSSPASTKS